MSTDNRRCGECGAFVRSRDVVISRIQTDDVSIHCRNCLRRAQLARQQEQALSQVQDILKRVEQPVFAEWFTAQGTDKYIRSGGKMPAFDAQTAARDPLLRPCSLCYWYNLAQAKIALSKQTQGDKQQMLRKEAAQILDILEKVPSLERNDACNQCKLRQLNIQTELKVTETGPGGSITLEQIQARQEFIHRFWDHVMRSKDCLWCYLRFMYRDALKRGDKQEDYLARAMMQQLKDKGGLTAGMMQYLEGHGKLQLPPTAPSPQVVEGWLQQIAKVQCTQCLQTCKVCQQFV